MRYSSLNRFTIKVQSLKFNVHPGSTETKFKVSNSSFNHSPILLFKHFTVHSFFHRTIIPLLLFLIFSINTTRADEGMWVPLFLKQINEKSLIERGLKIPVEKIYSDTGTSLKDAVVLFGGGCTGEMISDQGLLLTNHHCGYSTIQSHSTVENDYLTHGYWAMNAEQELPCPGLTVTFIIRMEDISGLIFRELNDSMSEAERETKIKTVSDVFINKATEGTHYDASVRSFFNGNQFILFVTEKFKDIRLVGAPPSSIGNFGGDTDNWMWPRHTGDFSLFRIYSGKDNKPAEFSKENIPFKPRHFFTISLKGVSENDFTMVYGFPGRTQKYLSSHAVNLIQNTIDPGRIQIRQQRISLMEQGMKISDTVRIKYSSKQKGLSNAYKKWQGEVAGLKRLKTVDKKREMESLYMEKMIASGRPDLAQLIEMLDSSYTAAKIYLSASDYYNEAAMGIEVLAFANGFRKLSAMSAKSPEDKNAWNDEIEKLKKSADGFFKNYDSRVDEKVFSALLNLYLDNVDQRFLPVQFLKDVQNNKVGVEKLRQQIFTSSMFASEKKLNEWLSAARPGQTNRILQDPAYKLASAITGAHQQKVSGELSKLNERINILNRQYLDALLMIPSSKNFYPDANSTLRVAYGQVMGYAPRDAVKYDFKTSLDGVMEKEDDSNEEFIVPEKLKELYQKKDFGRYGVNQTMPVGFIASNHTTGGNSGSPVINAYGQLIGTNFDRVWEGTMSDLDFDPDQCRNITLDIRYTLFIIDKFAGCKRLIDEMSFAE